MSGCQWLEMRTCGWVLCRLDEFSKCDDVTNLHKMEWKFLIYDSVFFLTLFYLNSVQTFNLNFFFLFFLNLANNILSIFIFWLKYEIKLVNYKNDRSKWINIRNVLSGW